MSGRLWWVAALIVVVFVALAAAVFSVLPMSRRVEIASGEGDIKRGAYLTRLGGCYSCHTEEGGEPFAGGVHFETPFGIFVSPNITPDAAAGIGSWTLGEFAVAMRRGVSPDGQPYYPAFPYQFYADMPDQDIADLWAALRFLPASGADPGGHETGFPFSFRGALKFWRIGNEARYVRVDDPGRSAEWNRGRDLVNGLGHCGACHTPRNLAGGRRIDNRLEGNPDLFGGGDAPALVGGALAASGWTQAALVQALRSGTLPDGDVFGGGMAEYVRDNSSFFLTSDLEAIAVYLLDH